MKLHTFDPAPNPRRLNEFMKYKGIEIETQQWDMMTGAHLNGEYRAVVPAQTLPALVLDDGTIITEVIGACSYLEDIYPDKPLMGTNALERAKVLSWDHYLFNHVILAAAEVLRNSSPGFVNRALPGVLDLPQIAELAERGKMRLESNWQQLEADVPASGWLAGEHFSLADIDLLVCSDFGRMIKQQPPESCTRLHAFLERIKGELA